MFGKYLKEDVTQNTTNTNNSSIPSKVIRNSKVIVESIIGQVVQGSSEWYKPQRPIGKCLVSSVASQRRRS